MKIKLFENKSQPKFNIGDIVYAVRTDNSVLNSNVPYEVKHFTFNKYQDEYQYSLVGVPLHYRYFEDRFISEEEYAVKKYNL